MLLIADLIFLLILAVRGGKPMCQKYWTKEMSQFSKEGDVNIGGIFSFHQNPVSVNPAFEYNPGPIQCQG